MSRCFVFGNLLLLLWVAGCSGEEALIDQLEPTGLLGEWGFQKSTVNGIQDLAAPLNDTFLSLEADDKPDDLRGRFRKRDPWGSTQGTFELRMAEGEMIFTYENTRRGFAYRLEKDALYLLYEEGDDIIEDHWMRLE